MSGSQPTTAKSLGDLEPLPDAVSTLTRLLLEETHERHEDIVFELGLLGDAAAVPAIAQAVNIPFASLVRWGNLQAFQRKCAYALARIGTPESRAVLEHMASSADPDIQAYGEEGLARWPLK